MPAEKMSTGVRTTLLAPTLSQARLTKTTLLLTKRAMKLSIVMLTAGRTFEEVEPELQSEYVKTHGNKGLSWDKAKPAAQDAYLKLYQERLVADKHREKTGEVTVGKRVETETARVSVPIEKERVVVERTAATGQNDRDSG